jgi:hypothetical protein
VRTRWDAVLVALLVLPLGACGAHTSSPAASHLPGAGSTTGSSTLDRAFWVRAGRACHPYRVFDDAHPSTVPGMNPERPTKAQLGLLAAFDRRTHSPFAVPRAWTRVVARLGTPRTGVDAWRSIAADFRAYDAATAAERRATSARDPHAWHVAYDRTVTVLGDLSTDLYAASVPSSNECMRLFG